MDTKSVQAATIARIFREIAFKNDETKITVNALALASEYIKLFVNEAIIRSNDERLLEGDSLTKVDGIDNVLQHQDEVVNELSDDDVEIPEDESSTQAQLRQAQADTTDLVDSRHLAKIGGILVLDF